MSNCLKLDQSAEFDEKYFVKVPRNFKILIVENEDGIEIMRLNNVQNYVKETEPEFDYSDFSDDEKKIIEIWLDYSSKNLKREHNCEELSLLRKNCLLLSKDKKLIASLVRSLSSAYNYDDLLKNIEY